MNDGIQGLMIMDFKIEESQNFDRRLILLIFLTF